MSYCPRSDEMKLYNESMKKRAVLLKNRQTTKMISWEMMEIKWQRLSRGVKTSLGDHQGSAIPTSREGPGAITISRGP